MAAWPQWWVPAVALVALVVLTILFELATKGRSDFVNPENLLNILRQWSFVGIIAIGMTFVITLGGIDLSVGSLVAFLGGLGIWVLNRLIAHGTGETTAMLAAFAVMIVVGAAAGALNGLLVTLGRIAPFIATLGGLAAYRSLAQSMVDGGEFRSASRDVFSTLGSGGIPIPGTNIGVNPANPIPLLFPWPVLILIVVAIIAGVLLNRTRYGRYVIAIGSNERSAVYSAIRVPHIKVLTYLLLGFCTGLASMLLASRMNSISSGQTGNLYELEAIAAVVIGGTRMRGGSGTIVGTLIGVLILGVIGNMLNMLQVSVYLQGLVKGLIIIAAALLQRAESRD